MAWQVNRVVCPGCKGINFLNIRDPKNPGVIVSRFCADCKHQWSVKLVPAK